MTVEIGTKRVITDLILISCIILSIGFFPFVLSIFQLEKPPITWLTSVHIMRNLSISVITTLVTYIIEINEEKRKNRDKNFRVKKPKIKGRIICSKITAKPPFFI